MYYKYQSYLYNRLYGASKLNYLVAGEYLVDGKIYKGALKLLTDTFSIGPLDSFDVGDRIAGNIFQQDCLIVYAMLFYIDGPSQSSSSLIDFGVCIDNNDSCLIEGIPMCSPLNSVFTLPIAWAQAPVDSQLYIKNAGPFSIQTPIQFSLVLYYSSSQQ